MQNNTVLQKEWFYRRLTNIPLLIFGVITTVSGLYIQIHYHILDGGSSGYGRWTFTHKWSALIFILIVIAHILLHLKWYKIVFKKRLFIKNRVTIILTIIVIVVSLLGFLPWVLTLFTGQLTLWHILIEIHDKIGVAFMVIMIGHILKRRRWYINLR